MFWKKKQIKTNIDTPVESTGPVSSHTPSIDFTKEIIDDLEKENVAVIASAILSTSYSEANVKIQSVKAVDQDKEAAALIVAAVLAHDAPNTTFRLVSIEEGSL